MASVKDRIGDIYGQLTVLSRAANTTKGTIQWHCKCTCGKKTIVRSGNLTSGSTKSCGCLQHEGASKRSTIDLIGETFGFLTVTNRAAHKSKYAYWACKCTCGTVVVISSHNLRTGKTASCGCIKTASLKSKADNKTLDMCYRFLQKHRPDLLKGVETND